MQQQISVFYSIILSFTGFNLSFVNAQIVKDKIPVLVTKISNNHNNDFISFKYDGNKLLEVEDGEVKSIYTYTGNYITQIQDYKNEELINTAIFSYLKNGNVKTIKTKGIDEQVGPNTPYTKTYTFNYPSPNIIQCTEIRNYHYADNTDTDTIRMKYNINNGNAVLHKDSYYNEGVLDVEISKSYTYDTKNNPYLNILGYDKIWIYLSEALDESLTGKNNMLSYKVFMEKSKDYGSKAQFTITYNSKNFPVNIVSKYYNKQGIVYESKTYTYTYNQ
jgi:hypothetical protein